MGWTECKEILTSFKSIMDYIEKEDSFTTIEAAPFIIQRTRWT